jgi:hypothetical protein
MAFDHIQARNERSGKFDFDCSENDPSQLHKCDDSELFMDDLAAWKLVARRAAEGSEYHRAVLTFLKEHNPLGFAEVDPGAGTMDRRS